MTTGITCKNMMRHYPAWFLALPILLLASHPAWGSDAPPPPPTLSPSAAPAGNPGGWTFHASPYFWAAGIDGKLGQFTLPAADVKTPFGDILKNLDFAFMGVFEGRRDRLSVFGDLTYTRSSAHDDTAKGILTHQIGVTSKVFSGLLGGGYALLGTGRSRLDAMVGVRLWHSATTVSLQGGLLDGTRRRDSATWADAVVGLRGQHGLSDRLYLSGWGNIGAGGARLDWDLALVLGYRFRDSLSAVAGYRAQGVDYRRNGFVFDIVQKGPVLGLVFSF